MIHIDEPTKLIFVRGVYTFSAIEEAYLEQTGRKRFMWRRYTFVGLADDNSRGLQTGMSFQPPDDGRGEIGFRYSRKNEQTRGSTKRKGRRKRG